MGGFMDHKDRRVLRVNWRVIASVRMCVMTADSPVLGVLYISITGVVVDEQRSLTGIHYFFCVVFI